MNIQIFGDSCASGYLLVELLNKNRNFKKINCFSRRKEFPFFVDLDVSTNLQGFEVEEESIIISFAPIWKFTNFLLRVKKSKPDFFINIKGMIICSSSSAITKRFSFSNFDKNLAKNLLKSEKSLENICNQFDISLTILRPSMIYGSGGGFKDKNLSKIIFLMRFTPIIFLPKNNGLRQPLHAQQLVQVIFKLVNEINQRNSKSQMQIFEVGGDEEISYFSMCKKMQASLTKNDLARKCIILKVPDNIFWIISTLSICVSQKVFESILRISSNLSGFTPSYKIIGCKPRKFPLKK